MFGILNWKDLTKEELNGVESLAINPKEKIYLFVDIPEKYEYAIIDRFGEVDVVTIKCKEPKETPPLFSARVLLNYGSEMEESYNSFKDMKIFGKNILFCFSKELYLKEYKDFFKVVVDYSAPGSYIKKNGCDRTVVTLDSPTGKIKANTYYTAQVFPIALYVKEKNEEVLLMQGNESCVYLSIQSLFGNANNKVIENLLSQFAQCKENILEKASGSERYLKEKLNKKKEELDQIITDINEVTYTAQKTIVDNTRKIPRILQSIDIVQKDLENAEALLKEGIKKIKELPDIVDAFMSEMILIVKTKKLHALTTMPSGDKRDVYYGKFTLLVNMENARIYAINEEFNYNGKDHPHGFLEKNLCLGSISQDIATLVGSFDIANIVAIMIDFLRSANKSDCEGCKVASWPYIENNIINPNKVSVYNSPLTLEEN